jgi:nitrogen fixation NifU-like protein
VSAAYLPLVLEHYRHPRNFGALEAPTVSEEGANPLCGDRIRIDLAVRSGRLEAARFRGDACAITIAAASLLTEHVTGQTLLAAAALGEADVLALLGADIPSARRRCATLPLDVLLAAVRAVRPG